MVLKKFDANFFLLMKCTAEICQNFTSQNHTMIGPFVKIFCPFKVLGHTVQRKVFRQVRVIFIVATRIYVMAIYNQAMLLRANNLFSDVIYTHNIATMLGKRLVMHNLI